MPVSLTTAKPGERFEARDGGVWVYERSGPVGLRFTHLLVDKNGHTSSYAVNGQYLPAGQSEHDLIRALDSPAPAPAEPMGDVGLVERLREWASCAGHSQITSMKRDLMLAATRIEALLLRATKAEAALDEARKVIAPLTDHPSLYPDKNPSWPKLSGGFGVMVEFRYFEAARDWHSKHGGGE